jgi:hypothetical protein
MATLDSTLPTARASTVALFAAGAVVGAAAALLARQFTRSRRVKRDTVQRADPAADMLTGAGGSDAHALHDLLASPVARRYSSATASAAREAARKRTHVICLTGGPCSGKSTSLETFVKTLSEVGFDVVTCPETPTLV